MIWIGKTKTNLFSIKNSVLVPATSISAAQVIEIDFSKDIDKLPVVYSKANNSTMNIFVGGGENQPQAVKTDFFIKMSQVNPLPIPLRRLPMLSWSLRMATRILSHLTIKMYP